ncbi:MAG: hypothetical protein HYX25_00425 [Candidatus Solibacter usitatus]|nr:hypothetical protein [Candidatus Solibacter usitatus]
MFRRAGAQLVPSLSDCLFLALLIWVFALGSGWISLLADGDTGWHIRTGEYILDTRSVPARDLFSFSKPNAPWFAWEWLADVIFAALNRAWGLKGVVVFAAVTLCASATLLFRHMLWRGANVLAALIATLLATAASTVHYLARPHIFTIFGLTAGLWILDCDLRRPGRAIWWLVPATALWANLHGGFLGWIACLGLTAAAYGLRRMWPQARRYALLTAACSAATLANPYGYELHRHIIAYLRSDWIRQVVEEFQSPKFRSENMLHFEILLFAGLGLLPLLWRKGHLKDALLLIFWAHAALGSARHVPLYAIVAAPICAGEASVLWSHWTAACSSKSLAGILRDCVRDFSAMRPRTSLWLPLVTVLVVLAGRNWPLDFPSSTFPSAAVNRNLDRLAPGGKAMPHILTTDQWGDYLIYRLYPRQRVFVDGRSDFYGAELGGEYLRLLNPAHDWEAILAKYEFRLALLPAGWPLAQLLKQSPRWRVEYDDGATILFEVHGSPPSGLNLQPSSAESLLRGNSALETQSRLPAPSSP